MKTPMIIDSFAGGGGASTAIEMALGRSPDVAINHDAAALALHTANHPDTLHLNSNIWDVDPREVVNGRHVGLLWASPDCKHFSKAKGGAPKDRNIRDLAWIVVKWAEEVKPDVILMENVEEFRTWGPICNEGQPIKELAGVTFELWVKRLRKAGYKIQWRELRACDYGDPTIRKRFFMVARRDGRAIVWPKPTHGDPKSKDVQSGRLEPWRTAAECIDWSLPCPSIFDTKQEIKEKHGLNSVRPLANNTLARAARGLKRYVLDSDMPFLVSVAHGYSGGRRDYPLSDPLGTVTAGGISRALVSPSITRFNGGATGQDLRAPLATVTANSWIKKPGGAAPLGIVAPHLMSLKGTSRRDSSPLQPHPTVLAGGGHSAILAPILTYAQQGGRNRDPLDPMHTICASRKDQNAVFVPMLAQNGYGERKGQEPRTLDPHAPLGTIVAGSVKHAPMAAFLAQHNKARSGVHPGRPIDAPISTLTRSGSHQNIIAPWFAKYYGTGDGARSDDPIHTITSKDRMGHFEAKLSAPAFGPEHERKARMVADLMRDHGYWDEREFVTLNINGETFVIVDVGMRMLTPRELFNAQGFPSDYVIEGVWSYDSDTDNWSFRPFTKNVQVSCVGNSVCPGLASELVGSNCQHLKKKSEPFRKAGS